MPDTVWGILNYLQKLWMVDSIKWGKIEDLWDNPPQVFPMGCKEVAISKIVDWKHCCGLGTKGTKSFYLERRQSLSSKTL